MSKGEPYSLDEDRYIWKNYARLGPTVIAEVLGRSALAIYERMRLLKKRKPEAPEVLSLEQVHQLSRAEGMTYGQYVASMGGADDSTGIS